MNMKILSQVIFLRFTLFHFILFHLLVVYFVLNLILMIFFVMFSSQDLSTSVATHEGQVGNEDAIILD